MNYVCERCGKSMDEANFYTYKDGTKTELCKKCLTAHIDNFNPDTYLWLLEKMDVPYIPEEWNVLRDRAYAKDPHKMNGMSVFGKYLSKMKLKQWKQYGWADTEKLRAQSEERVKNAMAVQKQYEEEMKQKLENGEISEAQYKTLVSTETQNAEMQSKPPQSAIPQNNFYNENNFLSEDELIDPAAELTADDKVYLAEVIRNEDDKEGGILIDIDDYDLLTISHPHFKILEEDGTYKGNINLTDHTSVLQINVDDGYEFTLEDIQDGKYYSVFEIKNTNNQTYYSNLEEIN